MILNHFIIRITHKEGVRNTLFVALIGNVIDLFAEVINHASEDCVIGHDVSPLKLVKYFCKIGVRGFKCLTSSP
jgi:hypothetical protein